jgi:hypothetical protein
MEKPNWGFAPLFILTLIGLGLISYFVYSKVSVPTQTYPTEPPLTEVELARGWYWGSETQKKIDTPSDWVFSGSGSRSDCWHKLGVSCNFTPSDTASYTCPKTSWVNCMPGPDSEGLKLECTDEYLTWAQANCPSFEGAAY